MPVAGVSMTAQDLYQVYLMEYNRKVASGEKVTKQLEMLVGGSQLLASYVGPYFLDIPYKQRNSLYYMTIPYWNDQRVSRGDKGVNLLKVKTRDGVEVDLVYYIREGKKLAFEIKLKPATVARESENLVLRQSRGFFGNKLDISPILASYRGRFSTMINKF